MRPFIRLGVLIVALSLGGCGRIWTSFDAYEGPRKPDSELAVIRETYAGGKLVSISKESGQLIWRNEIMVHPEVRLQPGLYNISYYSGYNQQQFATLDLMAGHRYSIRADYCGKGCHDLDRIWIEDQTTGQVVAGKPPGSPAEPGINVETILKSKGLGSPDCVHPADLAAFLKLYASTIDSRTDSLERTPLLYRPRGFTVVMRYDLPSLADPVHLLGGGIVVKPGDTIRACGFSESIADAEPAQIIKNACMQIFKARNVRNDELATWLVGQSSSVAGTCIGWSRRGD